MHNKVWDKITYPFPNFNDYIVEVWEWISNYIPHFKMDVITYPCCDSVLIKGAPGHHIKLTPDCNLCWQEELPYVTAKYKAFRWLHTQDCAKPIANALDVLQTCAKLLVLGCIIYWVPSSLPLILLCCCVGCIPMNMWYHIEAEIRWLSFCRQHFLMNFLH